MSYLKIFTQILACLKKIKTIFAPSHFEDSLKRDQELLWQVTGKKIVPSWRQFKYIGKTYSVTELLITKIAAALILLSIIGWSANLYFYHQIVTPTIGGEYVEAIVGSPSIINPLFATTDSADYDLTSLMFSSLLRADEQGNLVPDLAEKYIIDAKQTTYTFILRPDLQWHDNEPLTANDVLFTIQSIKDSNFKSPLYGALRGVEANLVDDRTLTLTLPEPFAPFPTLLTFGILPEHLWQEIDPKNASLAELNLKPIGSGPYKFVSFNKDKKGNILEYKLTRFPKYYKEGPFIENLTLKFFAESGVAAEAVIMGNADGFGFLSGDIKLDQADKFSKNGWQKIRLGLPQYTALFFNQQRNSVLADKSIRQALAMAINKEELINRVFPSGATVATAPILPGMVGYDSSLAQTAFDVDKSGKLLDDAGWKCAPLPAQQAPTQTEANNQGSSTDNIANPESIDNPSSTCLRQKTISKKTGNETKTESIALTIKLTVVQKDKSLEIARTIAEFWEKIGIKVELVEVEGSTIQKDIIKTRDYEILLFGQILGRDSDPYPFWHSSQNSQTGFNLAGYNNKEADKLLLDARQNSDINTRQAKYQEFQKKLLDDYAAIFLYSLEYNFVIPSKIKGANITRIAQPGDRFDNINKLFIKTKKKIQFSWY